VYDSTPHWPSAAGWSEVGNSPRNPNAAVPWRFTAAGHQNSSQIPVSPGEIASNARDVSVGSNGLQHDSRNRRAGSRPDRKGRARPRVPAASERRRRPGSLNQ